MKYLEELAFKVKVRQELDELDEIISKHVKPSPPGFSVKSVRKDRDDVLH